MARLVEPVENSDNFQEAERLVYNAQYSASDKNDNISERELNVILQIGMLQALIEIARQLNLIAIMTEDNTQ